MSFGGGAWSGRQTVPNTRSIHAPAAAAWGSKIYLTVVTPGDEDISYGVYDPVQNQWETRIDAFGDVQADSAVAILNHSLGPLSTLFIAWNSKAGQIQVSRLAGTVVVDAQLMENFDPGVSVTGVTQFAAAQDGSGAVQFFAAWPDNGGVLGNYYNGPGATSGWNLVSTGLSGTAVAVGLAGGTLVAYAASGSTVAVATASTDAQGGQTWTSQGSISLPSGSVVGRIVAQTAGGQLWLAIVLSDGTTVYVSQVSLSSLTSAGTKVTLPGASQDFFFATIGSPFFSTSELRLLAADYPDGLLYGVPVADPSAASSVSLPSGTALLTLVETERGAVEIAGVFQKVGATFKDLFDWLAFVFDWESILRARDVIKQAMKVSLEAMALKLGKIKTTVDDAITSAQGTVSATVAAFLQETSPSASLAGQGGTLAPAAPALAQSAANNPMLWGVVQAPDTGGTLFAAVDAAAARDVEQRLQDTVAIVQPVADANPGGLALVQQSDGTAEGTVNQPMSILLTGIEGLVNGMLGVTRSAIDTLLEGAEDRFASFEDMLETSLEIPFITRLYKQITGSNLTPEDLLSLMLAIPTNTLATILTGQPLVTAEARTALMSFLTKETLIGNLGLGGDARLAAPPADAARVLALVNATATFAYAVLETIVDLDAVTGGENPVEQILLNVADVVVAWTIWGTALANTSSPILAEQFYLLFGGLMNGADTVVLAATKGKGLVRNGGAVVDGFFGLLHLLSAISWATADVNSGNGNAIKAWGNLLPTVQELAKFLLLLPDTAPLTPLVDGVLLAITAGLLFAQVPPPSQAPALPPAISGT